MSILSRCHQILPYHTENEDIQTDKKLTDDISTPHRVAEMRSRKAKGVETFLLKVREEMQQKEKRKK